MKTITENQFWDDYVPIQNHLIPEDDDGLAWNGTLFETLRPDLDYVRDQNKQRPERIWTLLEVDDGLVISSGMHYVNRMGFFITEKPWTETTVTEILEGQNP